MRNYRLCLMFLILTLTLSCAYKYARKSLANPTVVNAPIENVWKVAFGMLEKEPGFKLKEVKHKEYFLCAQKRNLLCDLFLFRHRTTVCIKLEPLNERQTIMYFRAGKEIGDFKDLIYLSERIKAVAEGRPLESVLAERKPDKLDRSFLTPETNGFSLTYNCGYDTALKCAIVALQNLGFSISQVNDKVGLILASKTPKGVYFHIFYGTPERVVIKANVHIEPVSRENTKVRLILIRECLYRGTPIDMAIYGLSGAVKEEFESKILGNVSFYEPFFDELKRLIDTRIREDYQN